VALVAEVILVILVGVIITAEVILVRGCNNSRSNTSMGGNNAEVILVWVVITGETEDRKGDDHKKKRTVKECRM
jgi:hypothetical protein